MELLEQTQSPLETLGLRAEFSPSPRLRLVFFFWRNTNAVYLFRSSHLMVPGGGVLGGLTRLSPTLSYQLWKKVQEACLSSPEVIEQALSLVVFQKTRPRGQAELTVARVLGLQENLPTSFNEETGARCEWNWA